MEQLALLRDNLIIGLIILKTTEETKCDLDVAAAWSVSAKIVLKNITRFSSNQLVFGKNPNFSGVCTDSLLASQPRSFNDIVAENLNTLHSARNNFIKMKILQNSKIQTLTFTDIILVILSFKDSQVWRGPRAVIRRDVPLVLLVLKWFFLSGSLFFPKRVCHKKGGVGKIGDCFKKGSIYYFRTNQVFPKLFFFERLMCEFCLSTPFLSIYFVFYRKNLSFIESNRQIYDFYY